MADEEQKKKNRLWVIILIACLVVFAVACGYCCWYFFPMWFEKEVPQPVVSQPTESVVLAQNPIDFAAQKEQNDDIIAWIQVPGTVIDYPILQSSPDEEENFYIHRGLDKKYRHAGSIYIQKGNEPDFTDPNTVVYGHYMANGSMFADLHQFRKRDFFDRNQYIYVYTPGHILTYRIFSAFVYDNRNVLYSFDYSTQEGYAMFLNDALHPTSLAQNVREDVAVTTDDRIISLCTCTMKEQERYLVEGVLVNDELTY